MDALPILGVTPFHVIVSLDECLCALLMGCLLLATSASPEAEAQEKSGFATLIQKVKDFAQAMVYIYSLFPSLSSLPLSLSLISVWVYVGVYVHAHGV